MPEMLFRPPRFLHSTCGLFTKNKEQIQKSKETVDSRLFFKTN